MCFCMHKLCAQQDIIKQNLKCTNTLHTIEKLSITMRIVGGEAEKGKVV